MNGFQPPCPGPSDSSCIGWWDFESLDAGGTLVADHGRLGLHLTPTALAAPAYGLSRTAKGKGRWTLNGTTQYGAVAAAAQPQFYANVPTSVLTLAFIGRFNAPTANDRLCACIAGAGRGFALRQFTTARMIIDTYDSAGNLSTISENVGVETLSKTQVVIISINRTGGTGAAWRDGVGQAVTFAGNTNPIAYDVTTPFYVGTWVTLGNLYDGDMMFLAAWRDWIPSDREAKALSAWLRDVM